MLFSIDMLSIKSEAQKVKLNTIYSIDTEQNEKSLNIFMIEDLVEQEPITII